MPAAILKHNKLREIYALHMGDECVLSPCAELTMLRVERAIRKGDYRNQNVLHMCVKLSKNKSIKIMSKTPGTQLAKR